MITTKLYVSIFKRTKLYYQLKINRLQACLYLRWLPSFGNILARKLLTHCKTPEAIFESDPQDFLAIDRIGTLHLQHFKKWRSLETVVLREEETILKNNIKTLFLGDPNYPKTLSFCPDAPLVLFYKGDIAFKDQKIIGASPELLFRLKNGEMETYPLAGTTKRGKNSREDTQLARELLNDPKEIAEHNMLVDLHRNDIGKVAKFGTVKVRNLMDIKRYSHVQHISSEIVGIIDDKNDMFSALASNFPAGTLTGAPKIEAMKIINEIETSGRGPYGGAIGQFGFNGDCTFAIPIRSIFINGKNGFIQTCGGIVHDSIPENELLEIERKLAAMKSVLESF